MSLPGSLVPKATPAPSQLPADADRVHVFGQTPGSTSHCGRRRWNGTRPATLAEWRRLACDDCKTAVANVTKFRPRITRVRF
jgi:hypothetical protein